MTDFTLTRREWLQAASLLALAPAAGFTAAAAETDTALLDDLERRTFDFFWETTDRKTGMALDRWPSNERMCSIAAVGFALTAYIVGAERGFVTRAAARERVMSTLKFFWEAPQGSDPRNSAGHRGFFYHFLDTQTGTRWRDCELSTVDTALMLAGMLACQSWFDAPEEAPLRDLVDQIYARVDWAWAMPRKPLICHGWRPETGFIAWDWKAYDESQLVYLLALGTPGKPITADAYLAWSSGLPAAWGTEWGQTFARFGPLFGHQFTQCWVDLRGPQDDFMRDAGIDYFENSRRATLAQRNYAIANPNGFTGYGPDCWGVTASDGPADVRRKIASGRTVKFASYAGRGVGVGKFDDGTLAPYGAGSSIAFTPELSLRALRHMKERYGEHLYGRYGFLDAFNPSFTFTDLKLTHGKVVPELGWVDGDYLGIDQGPMLAMLGNHRGEIVWKAMRRNAHLRRGLQRAGFKGGWL